MRTQPRAAAAAAIGHRAGADSGIATVVSLLTRWHSWAVYAVRSGEARCRGRPEWSASCRARDLMELSVVIGIAGAMAGAFLGVAVPVFVAMDPLGVLPLVLAWTGPLSETERSKQLRL